MGNREQGGAIVKVVAAGRARRVTLTIGTACFIGKLKFEGKGAPWSRLLRSNSAAPGHDILNEL